MMRRPLASFALALSLGSAPVAHAESKPAAKKGESKAGAKASPAPAAGALNAANPLAAIPGMSAPFPKAAGKGPEASEALKKIPPFFGLFGTEEMIQKVGFRSRPGTYIDFDIDPNSKDAGDSHGFRLAEVGPAVPGGRWIEMVSKSATAGDHGIRLFTRGEKKGNIERLIARVGGMPPMEFPLETLNIQAIGGGVPGVAQMGLPARMVGKETITTPLGQFKTDHWVVDTGNQKHPLEFWLTDDPKIPFTGLVKMVNNEGTVLASKVGTDATESIQVPPRM